MKVLLITEDSLLSKELHVVLDGWNLTCTSNYTEGAGYCITDNFDAVLTGTDRAGIYFSELWSRSHAIRSVPCLIVTSNTATEFPDIARENGAPGSISVVSDRESFRSLILSTKDEMGKSHSSVGTIFSQMSARRLNLNGKCLHFTSVEADILMLLAAAAGGVVRREELYSKVLRREWSPFDRSLDTHISNLRKKLESACLDSPLIRSVRGVGYQLFV